MSGKLKDITNIGSSSKSKNGESKISNNSEPNKNYESKVSTASSSSRVHFRLFKSSSGTIIFRNDHVTEIKGYGDYQIGNVTISWVYYVEGKSKKHTHKPKSDDSIQQKLYLLHMDLCGPMRIESINGKKYILVIVDDYSRFTWVKCLQSKDETPKIVIKLLNKIQVRLNATSITYEPLKAMASEQFGSGPELQLMTPGTISSGLYFNPLPSVVSPVLVAAAPRPANPNGISLSTSIEQDAPAASTSLTI
ncbi:integrase, catalytic region, zinc finger, CCHC-type containing protein [Tanacetum coccineum]